MLDEHCKQNIRKDINTICQTAITVIETTEPGEESDLVQRLGQTADAIAAHYGMEPELMEGYHTLIKATLKKSELERQASSFRDAEQAKELIYALCDGLADPKEIKSHVRTADEMMAVWESTRN